MKRRHVSSLIVCAALCGERAFAQSYQQRQFDITHTINLPPQPIFGSMTLRGHFFDHAWLSDALGHGIAWDAVPPWTTPPIWPNPQPQPSTFEPYGIEFFGPINVGCNYWQWMDNPFDVPFNTWRCGFSPVTPQPVNTVSGVSTGDTLPIPEAGTQGIWSTTASVPITPATFAQSEFDIQPFSQGSGYLDATIRSVGQWHQDYSGFGYHSYAFAWTELDVGRLIRPQLFPPGIPVQWSLRIAGQLVPPAPMWMPFDPNLGRYWDPIRFKLTDLSNGQVTTGELFELYVDLALGGSITGADGNYTLDTQEGGLHVRMDHPFITPHGSVDFEVDNGVVITSRATGCFASMLLPPLGAVTPYAITFPSSSFDFVFDPTSAVPGDSDVVFSMGGAGIQDLVRPEPTGAACVNGVCTSGVTASQAASLGAVWQGPATACPDVPYFIDETRAGFEDIASFGTPSSAGNCDDCGETVPLGFNFNYFGSNYTSVGLASNGYLAFSGPLNVYSNPPIPTAGGANGVLAGYWDDLDPFASGDVHYTTLGVAPSRRFIAQWTDVPHFQRSDLLHTFEIVLHETTNEIVYRYLDAPSIGGVISPTIGVESPAGTKGLALEPLRFTPNGTARLVRAPGMACPPPSSVAYCTAGTTTNGCNAMMSSSGVPSASASAGFVVSCNSVEGQKQGILFYGVNGRSAMPWFGGSTSYLCATAPLQRCVGMNAGGTTAQCNGVMSFDLLAYLATNPNALGAPFLSGEQCWLQGWFRDPPAPNTTNLSNGLEVTFQP